MPADRLLKWRRDAAGIWGATYHVGGVRRRATIAKVAGEWLWGVTTDDGKSEIGTAPALAVAKDVIDDKARKERGGHHGM